jgi:hypothetical protein
VQGEKERLQHPGVKLLIIIIGLGTLNFYTRLNAKVLGRRVFQFFYERNQKEQPSNDF